MPDIERLFSEADFDDMLYPVHRVPIKESVFHKFDAMATMNSFANFKDEFLSKNDAIRYVVFCYDRESPIYKKFRNDDIKRKTTAAEYAGWKADPETGLFTEPVDYAMKGFNPRINLMVIDYVRQYMDPEFAVVEAGYIALYDILENIASIEKDLDPTIQLKNQKMKVDLWNKAREVSAQISDMTTKITTDENKYQKRDLYSTIDPNLKNRLFLDPESRAGIK